MIFRAHKKVIFFHLLLNFIFALFITCSSYYHIPLNGGKDVFMYFMHLCIIQSTFAGVLYIISLSNIVFKTTFSILFLVLGFISFWVYSIDISVSPALINATLTTKSYIIKDLISIQLVLYILVLIGVLFLIFRFYNRLEKRKGYKVFVPTSIALICLFFWVDQKRLQSFSSKLPYSLFYSAKEYWEEEELPLKNIKNVNFKEPKEDIKVVLVIGESLRADHLQLNGYIRETTPKLAKRKNVVSFNNVFTNKTNTALSIPNIVTNQSIYGSDRDSIISLFDMMDSRNILTKWIGNQLLESSYKQIVETNNEVLIIDELRSFWSFNKKKDLSLVSELEEQISKDKKGLFSLHMIGSHWWYEDKYTDEFRRFKPVVDSKYIPSMTKNQMINSYDNTILYLDNFLDQTITVLEQQQEPSILIYISDHGEALGEDGKWLHSHYKSLTNPGMIVWYSDSFRKKYKEKTNILTEKKNESITTDVIYHSILDIFNIKEYNGQESIFYCDK
ncbi:phosphoethanolamine transferase [Aquimarina sp. 2201CG14-23]|uniref:phosphoethanolamine transferase n=1 Tax=Aquimarina mycalae TaxID=3040073 RepID=UPI0024782913|nr:sulfatase-like hydrolase/transferase [Aquimarina sp. 2201CG14-23]MDH7446316.1 sulfatase-like hydrolase/transferase [Aquimarina sp. 2201CG14-23]